jgi:acyl-coenzyme A thioesterase PaaI-like protein
MALSDVGMYFAVLASIGPVALAVTTNLNINFLRKPPEGELVVETRLLKLGRRLAVGEVYVRGPGSPDVISQATVTYSIPPER